MGYLYVARSATLAKWGSDVGLGKNLFRLGLSEEDPANIVKQAAWCGMADWVLVKKVESEGLSEEEAIAKLGRKEKMVDPVLYPKIKGERGIFKIRMEQVESHILVSGALEGIQAEMGKVKPADIGSYMIHNVLR
jgi:hypothetical protein